MIKLFDESAYKEIFEDLESNFSNKYDIKEIAKDKFRVYMSKKSLITISINSFEEIILQDYRGKIKLSSKSGLIKDITEMLKSINI